MQREVLIVDTPEQARALQDSGFLSRFLEPVSPSDVARGIGISANLAHHHARRYASLGLLNEVKREGGKVYYQLAARTFKHDRSLLPAGDPTEHTSVTLVQLGQRFLAAYERSDRASSYEDTSWHVYVFDREGVPPEEQPKPLRRADINARPAHFQARTFSLRPERYRQLVRQIAQLLIEAEADDSAEAKPCTMAFLALDEAITDGSDDAHFLSTLVPAAESHEDRKTWKL